jgi:hypothetical protein
MADDVATEAETHFSGAFDDRPPQESKDEPTKITALRIGMYVLWSLFERNFIGAGLKLTAQQWSPNTDRWERWPRACAYGFDNGTAVQDGLETMAPYPEWTSDWKLLRFLRGHGSSV